MFLRCLLRAALTFSLLSFGGPPRHAATATGSNRNPVALAASATTSSVPGAEPAAEPFLVKPYLQLGDARALASPERIELLWHTGDVDAVWTVETRRAAGRSWVKAAAPAMRRIALPGVEPHRVYDARITGLAPGREFEYRVSREGTPVFTARARARQSRRQPYRFAVFGDCGAGTEGQRAIAYQTYQARPDFVFIPGDIVYSRGRISEYRSNLWPVYNADQPSPAVGAPLLRSVPFLAAPGNHDIVPGNQTQYPDTLAYFLYWSQPLNGPLTAANAPNVTPLAGPEAVRSAFLEAAGPAYPRMANFSFDYGNSHWTVLDGNGYVDWTDPSLRAWVENDLASARNATWRFVAFHQPGFNSSKAHFTEQRMRVLSELFEKGGVDIVFAGHVHNYQRSFPMHFEVRKDESGRLIKPTGPVEGRWTLDKAFDGERRTRPDGIIYLVTGAGGAGLYDPEQETDPASWQPFTTRFFARTHSLTLVDVNGKRLTARQVSEAGQELDRFTVTK